MLFASAYVDDGVAVRRALVRQHVPLLAAIGSSSSYCMPAFGRRLGADAVGLFASDKPDAGVLDPASLDDQPGGSCSGPTTGTAPGSTRR